VTPAAELGPLASALYDLRLAGVPLANNAYLAVATGTDGAQVKVFSHTGDGAMQLLASDTGSLTLPDVATLAADGRDLVVLVTNTDLAAARRADDRRVTTSIAVRDGIDLAGADAAHVRLVFQADWGGAGVVSEELSFAARAGSYDDGVFSATWDSTRAGGWRDHGFLFVQLDPLTGELQSWRADRREENEDLAVLRICQAFGESAPLVAAASGSVLWRAEGPSVSESVNIVLVTENQDGDVTRYLYGYEFDGESLLEIRVERDE
jgi:hypothetical protein